MSERDVEVASTAKAPTSSGRRVIAVIGIDRYDHWPRLSNAVRDATGAAALFRRLGFQSTSSVSVARAGIRAGANVVGAHGSPSAASTARARAESATTAITLRRPPHGHDSTSVANTRRNSSSTGPGRHASSRSASPRPAVFAATGGHQRAELRPSLAGRAEHPCVAHQVATGWRDDPHSRRHKILRAASSAWDDGYGLAGFKNAVRIAARRGRHRSRRRVCYAACAMSEPEETHQRPAVAALDEILGRRFRVLDDGFVRLVDYLGDDSAIVQAARVSYGAGTKRYHEDRGLIRYLMRHRHTTPFEMCELKLHVRVPMDCWRQWIRHRTANVNEYSTRYSVAIDSAQRTPSTEWRLQASGNRQGSSGLVAPETGVELSQREGELIDLARSVYAERLAAGVAREQARKDLPLSTYTEAYWKVDLHNLFHFLSLRMDSHAQYEIRAYSNIIGTEIVSRWCPIAWEAFQDYRLRALELSGLELEVLKAIHQSPEQGTATATRLGLLRSDETKAPRSRELEELESKLYHLGLRPPWSDPETSA